MESFGDEYVMGCMLGLVVRMDNQIFVDFSNLGYNILLTLVRLTDIL